MFGIKDCGGRNRLLQQQQLTLANAASTFARQAKPQTHRLNR